MSKQTAIIKVDLLFYFFINEKLFYGDHFSRRINFALYLRLLFLPPSVYHSQNKNNYFFFRLVAGSPPNMPIYDGWIDCYRHLKQIRGLKRGSSMLWRAYTGPTIMLGGSPAIATNSMFVAPASSQFSHEEERERKREDEERFMHK